MNRRDAPFLAIAVMLGLAIRLAPALYRGDMIFDGYDEYYHLRRIFYTFHHFPHTLWFDSYINYPHGLEISWPPLFDIVVAAIAHVVAPVLGDGSVETVAAVISPILGGILVVVVYAIAREVFDGRTALISAFLLAVCPYSVIRTSFGSPDHHGLEVLLFSVIVLLLLYTLRGGHIWIISAGIAMAALAYTWAGAPIYLLLIPSFAVLRAILSIRDGSAFDYRPMLVSLAVASALVLPFGFSSWLHISFLSILILTTVVLLTAITEQLALRKNLPWIVLPASLTAFALIIIFINYSRLQSAIVYLVGGGMTGKIAEAEPLFVNTDPLTPLTLWLLLYILGAALLLYEIMGGSVKRDAGLLLLIWAVLALALTFGQKRFIYVSSTVGPILMALLLLRAIIWIRSYPSRRFIAGAALAIMIALPLTDLPVIVSSEPAITQDWVESLEWLRDNTPPTSYFEEPFQVPEYGVMCWWDYGNWIVYIGERPVVANNFQTGVVEGSRFFLSENEESAVKILKERRARYVITDLTMIYGKLQAICSWLGEDPSKYQRIYTKDGVVTVHNLERLNRTMLAGLHLDDCSYMEHFRLIHESRSFAGPYGVRPAAMIKIFEHVPGAVIRGSARDDRIVVAVLNLSSNLGRPFQYVNYAVPRNGSYEIRVPYSTEGAYGVKSAGPYQIVEITPATDGWGDVAFVNITEEDVLDGRIVELGTPVSAVPEP
ncbi:MAG: oligosaccharyl transferase, archaeosortase A system-associated [Methanothrix sp.]|uniref:oligosaccharyl transferase, archaeosortase A system-associated n=1 Tax=Methanothrix sp. TaxID=90426 RepID=UPI0025F71473|nr:oligosaccharyl transferase, archaeosortase A system-associated [Methanothrix sp.]MCQ8903104.1 oligosaccharyl transferase, archaeosortase A system-associated [Methanothrix sp.]